MNKSTSINVAISKQTKPVDKFFHLTLFYTNKRVRMVDGVDMLGSGGLFFKLYQRGLLISLVIESVETIDSVDSRLVRWVLCHQWNVSTSVSLLEVEVDLFLFCVMKMPESELIVRDCSSVLFCSVSRSRLIGLSIVIGSPRDDLWRIVSFDQEMISSGGQRADSTWYRRQASQRQVQAKTRFALFWVIPWQNSALKMRP